MPRIVLAWKLRQVPNGPSPDFAGVPGVEFDKVTLARGGTALFQDFDLQLADRRIGIIGNNGSGKSSLLRLINGLLLPDRGSVRVCGRETREHRGRLPQLAGFLFQNPDHQILFPTVGEEIAFGLREAGLTPAEATERTRAILAEHDCTDWEHRPVQELSEGQKQRLCIMAVLAMQPDILLLDEPFASLDWPTRQKILELLLQASQHIVMASHDFEMMAGFDRVIWLDAGRVAAQGPPADIIAEYKLHAQRDRQLAECA